jgi:hypothetical protein
MDRMSSNVFLAPLLACGLWLAQAHSAEPESAKKWEAMLRVKLLQKVDIDLDEAVFEEVVALIRQHTGMTVVVDPLVAQPNLPDTTVSLSECPVAEVIAKLLEPLGLQYAVRDEAIFIFMRNAYSDKEAPAAALTDAQLKDLNKAVADLAADDFEVRETATQRLDKMGSAAAPILAQSIKSTTDPETQMRIQKILARYSAKPFPGPSGEVARRLDVFDAQLKCELTDMTLGDAVKILTTEISKRSGKSIVIRIASDELSATLVSMPGVNMKAGNLLRWLSIASGATLVLDGDNLKMVSNRKSAEPKP